MLAVILLGLTLALATLVVYWRVGNHGFIQLDDYYYVVGNARIANGLTFANIAWAFTSLEVANWHPLTWLSYMADAQLYGLNAGGYHISSVVIHVFATLLLLWLLYRLTGAVWQSALVAALFALHPMHVESVAWVAERKDVLSALFWFLTLLLYAEYATTRRRSYYLLTLLSFALGLMAKPMLVTLPVVMLLLDGWPLKRVEGLPSPNRWSLWLPLVKEKIPFFMLSLLSAAITLYAQHKSGAVNVDMPLWPRFENAAIAGATYLVQMLWPHDLAVFYPLPFTFPTWKVAGSLSLLALPTVWVLRVRRRYPYLAVGWFWFLITLLPVIGLVRVGDQAMADRYTYIPYTGLFIMLAWGVPELTRRLPYRQLMHGLLAALALCACVAITRQQIAYWRDDVALFQHALQVTTNNALAHKSLGLALTDKGDFDAAITQFQAALAIRSHDDEAQGYLGLALANKGELDAAIESYGRALAINPGHELWHTNLGVAYAQKGMLDAAIKEFQVALAINPLSFDAHSNLGFAFAEKGDLNAAVGQFRAALRLNPNSVEVQRQLMNAQSGLGLPQHSR